MPLIVRPSTFASTILMSASVTLRRRAPVRSAPRNRAPRSLLVASNSVIALRPLAAAIGGILLRSPLACYASRDFRKENVPILVRPTGWSLSRGERAKREQRRLLQ